MRGIIRPRASGKSSWRQVKSNGKTWTRMVRLTFQERKERVAARIAKHAEKMLAED